LISFAAAAMSGFRNAIAAVGCTYFVGLCYRGGFVQVMIGSLVGLLALAMVGITNALVPLPPNVQRSLTFLPGTWDERYVLDAENSTEWRVELWKEALLTDRWISNKMFGDGLGFTMRELQYQMGRDKHKSGSTTLSGFDAQRAGPDYPHHWLLGTLGPPSLSNPPCRPRPPPNQPLQGHGMVSGRSLHRHPSDLGPDLLCYRLRNIRHGFRPTPTRGRDGPNAAKQPATARLGKTQPHSLYHVQRPGSEQLRRAGGQRSEIERQESKVTLEKLVTERVLKQYAIGGATAAGFHGEPLTTRDVDSAIGFCRFQ
jgi:hypothetical protein